MYDVDGTPLIHETRKYLEEAAAQLRLASKDNEQRNRDLPTALRDNRERIAGKFAELAAIAAGLLPPNLARDEAKK